MAIAEAIIDHEPSLHREGAFGAKTFGQAEEAEDSAYSAADPGSERHPNDQRAHLMGRVDQEQVSFFRRLAYQ